MWSSGGTDVEKLKTATGKKFDCDYFNPFPPLNQVFFRVLGLSLVEAVTVFSNPAETAALTWNNQYVAYHTKIVNITPEGDAIRLTLGRE